MFLFNARNSNNLSRILRRSACVCSAVNICFVANLWFSHTPFEIGTSPEERSKVFFFLPLYRAFACILRLADIDCHLLRIRKYLINEEIETAVVLEACFSDLLFSSDTVNNNRYLRSPKRVGMNHETMTCFSCPRRRNRTFDLPRPWAESRTP